MKTNRVYQGYRDVLCLKNAEQQMRLGRPAQAFRMLASVSEQGRRDPGFIELFQALRRVLEFAAAAHAA